MEDEPNKFVAGSGTDFVLVTWDSGLNLTKASSKVLSTVDKNRKNTRWNDGKVDSSGRFWGGQYHNITLSYNLINGNN